MIEFLEKEHIYLKNGIIVPSVTQILSKIFPNKYDKVPFWKLDAKAEYGTIVHLSIEKYEKNEELPTLNTYQKISLEEYKKLKEEYSIIPLEQETIVSYEYEFAGRLDMIAIVNGKKCLLDIKTTAILDKEWLSWQLSMYELAYGYDFDEFYCIWLPKGKIGKLVKIEKKSKKEILEKLEEIKNGI